MRYLLLILSLASCGDSNVIQGTNDLVKFEDKKIGVVCYKILYSKVLSCVKIKDVHNE